MSATELPGPAPSEPGASTSGHATPSGSAAPSADPAAPKPTSPVLLVGLGVAAGVFVLYTIGWAIGLGVTDITPRDALASIMTGIEVGVAIASGPLWFASVFLLTRRARTIWRLVFQALGVVLLVPWPFLGVWW